MSNRTRRKSVKQLGAFASASAAGALIPTLELAHDAARRDRLMLTFSSRIAHPAPPRTCARCQTEEPSPMVATGETSALS